MNLKIKVDEATNAFGFVESFTYQSYSENRTFKLVTSITSAGKFGVPHLYVGGCFQNLYEASARLASGGGEEVGPDAVGAGLQRYVKAKKPIHSLLTSDALPVSLVVKSNPKGIVTNTRILKPSLTNLTSLDSVRALETSAGDAVSEFASRLMHELLKTDGSRYSYLALRENLS